MAVKGMMMNKSDEHEHEQEAQRTEGRLVPGSGAAPTPRSASLLQMYKSGQGMWVRWISAAGAGILALGVANACYEWLGNQNEWVRMFVPVGVLLVFAYAIFWLFGRNQPTVNFMIATEGEMKKVNWSSRREVFGATKVVIVSVIALGVLLCIVDLLFIFWFEAIGVLRTGVLASFFKTQ